MCEQGCKKFDRRNKKIVFRIFQTSKRFTLDIKRILFLLLINLSDAVINPILVAWITIQNRIIAVIANIR